MHCIQVVKVPRMSSDEIHENSFVKVLNPKHFETSKITFCLWVLKYYEMDSWFLHEKDERRFRLSVTSFGNYVKIGSFYFGYKFPKSFEWIPDTWAHFCLTFDNVAKALNVSVNGDVAFQHHETSLLDEYKIAADFLDHQKIANAKHFAGEVTMVNVWSTILNPRDITRLYSCHKIIS